MDDQENIKITKTKKRQTVLKVKPKSSVRIFIKKNFVKIYFVISFVLIVVLLSLVVIFYIKLNNSNQDLSQSKIERIVKKVSKTATLPEDEQPSVIKVTNPESLEDQEFFSNANTGDIVLVYKESKKVILLEAKSYKIKNIADLNEIKTP